MKKLILTSDFNHLNPENHGSDKYSDIRIIIFMKRKLFLFTLAAMLFGYCGAMAQPELNVVWEKMIWPKEVKFAKFSKDGQWVYCAVNNNIEKLNPLTGEFVGSFESTGVSGIYDMDISEEGNLLYTYSSGEQVVIWDIKEEKVKKFISLEGEIIHEVTISPDEKYLILHTAKLKEGPGELPLFNVKYDIDKDSIISRVAVPDFASRLKYSPDGKYFALGKKISNHPTYRNVLELWSAETMTKIATLEDVEGSNEYVKFQFSNDGKYLGSLRGWRTTIFDLTSKEVVYYSGNGSECGCFTIYPENNFILIDETHSDSAFVNLLTLPEKTLIKKLNLINTSTIIETYKNDNTILTFVSGGLNTGLLSNKTVGISEQKNDSFNLKVSVSQITINSSELINSVKVIDNSGRILLIRDLTSNPQYDYSIENTYPSGTYICSIITIDGKTYSKSFQVVR